MANLEEIRKNRENKLKRFLQAGFNPILKKQKELIK